MAEEQNIGMQEEQAATGAEESQAQAAKTYTQQEVDDMMARMKSSVKNKVLKPYEDLGDPEELRNLKAEAEQRRQEEQLKRGEFEKTLQEMAAKKDAEIQKRDSVIKEYKINTPLITAAAKYNSVNPDQVKSLLASQVALNGEGEVEVLDSKGSVRYNDSGEPLGVDDLVREFIDSNPHFAQPTASTTHSKSNHSSGTGGKLDISKLDMSNPEHRKQYNEARKKGQL